MARTRKSISPLDLYKYDVLIEDRGIRSDYFRLSQFDGYLYGGRNALLIAGSGVLRPRTKILVEILNKNGGTIFSAPVSNFIEGNSRLVQAEVYRDTPIGPGKIVILGVADRYPDGTPIPKEWQNKYNVRYIADVIISPLVENKTPIRFVRPPSMVVEEKFYNFPTDSTFSQSIQIPVDVDFQTKYFNVTPNGYLAEIRNDQRFFSNQLGGKLTGSLIFTGSSGIETASVDLPISKIYNAKLAEVNGAVISTSRGNILLRGEIKQSGSYSASLEPFGVVPASSSLAIQYNELSFSEPTGSALELSGSLLSHATLRIVDLSTISGEINQVRLSYKSAVEPGEFTIIGNIPVRTEELLAVDTGSRIAETGKFRTVVLEDYWYAATMSISDTLPNYYYTASLITTSEFIEPCCNTLLDSINATPLDNDAWITGSDGINIPYFIGNRETNLVTLFPRSEYTLKFDAIVSRKTGSITLDQPDYSLEVYLVPTNTSETRLLTTEPLGQLIGKITPAGALQGQNYVGTELNFTPQIIESGDFGLRFLVKGGFWNIANVSLKVAEEPFFSPDEVNILLPNDFKFDDYIEFKAEYLDINNNSVGVETISLPTYFSGSRQYVLRSGDTMWGDLTLLESASLIVTGSGNITVDGGNIFVKNGGDVYVNNLGLYNEVLQDMTTGLVTGGLLITSSEYSQAYIITSGSGIIIDNETNPLNPTYSYVSWGDLIVTASAFASSGSVASYPRTNVAIDSNGDVFEQADKFTVNDYRNKIVLGRLAHVGTTNIQRTLSLPLTAYGRGYHWFDFVYSANVVNISGNSFGPYATDLRLEKTSGQTYRIGSNYENDPSRPDIKEDPTLSPVTFAYRYRDGAGGWKEDAETQIISGSVYDDGDGTLGTVNNNQWTVQRIFFFSATNTTRIQPGQNIYNSREDAQISAVSEEVEINPNLREDAVLRGFLILRGGATDLSDLGDAEFLEALQSGIGSGGGGTVSLNSLLDVTIDTPQNGQLLVYDSASAEWVNSSTIPEKLTIYDSGSTVLDVQGSVGQLLSIQDSLSGSLLSVNDISGVPVLQVFSDDKVVMGTYGENTLVVTGSNVGIGTSSPSNTLDVIGNVSASAFTGSLAGTASYANNSTLLNGIQSTVFATTGSNTFNGNQIVTGSFAVSGSLSVDSYNLKHVSLGNIAGSQSLNLAQGNYFSATTTGSVTWTFINAPTSSRAIGIVLELTDGGAYTQTWPVSVHWPSATAPTLTTSGVDVLTFITDDSGSIWRGVASMIGSAAP